MKIEEARNKIDIIDDKIVELFKERMELSKDISLAKKEEKIKVYDGKRERDIIKRLTEKNPDQKTYIRRLYKSIFELSKSYQKSLMEESAYGKKLLALTENAPKVFPKSGTIAVKGTDGCYAQQSAEKIFSEGDILYFDSFYSVFDAVSKGYCDFGVLPLENSSNGSVKEVYDLMKIKDFYIVGSFKLHIDHSLLVKEGTKIDDLTEIISHHQALEQCQEFFRKHPKIRAVPYSDTAHAAEKVSKTDRKDIGAISSKVCKDIYGLDLIDDNIQDSANNYTRFIVIKKEPIIYPGANKISIILSLAHKEGSLYQVLGKFNARGLNLVKLESRPYPNSDFEFIFYFDFEGSVYQKEIRDLLTDLKEESDLFSFLGNYREF